jgi:hypothetical protein
MKALYDLELHYSYHDNSPYEVTRVPGGWIYRDKELGTNTFVPFNNEFQTPHPKDKKE